MPPPKNLILIVRPDSTTWFDEGYAGSLKNCSHAAKVVYLWKGLLLYDLVEKKS